MPAFDDILTLGVMTKYWEIGQVKTRLGAAIGMQRAASLHQLFVAHLCRSLQDAADHHFVCLSPDDRIERFQGELRSWGLENWHAEPQGNGSLGERMQRWFERSLAVDTNQKNAASDDGEKPAGKRSAILIGADCPTLGAVEIENARRLLQSHDVVLGPAMDGGYYLIGIRGPWQSGRSRHEGLFQDIPWSTDQVLEITRRRIRDARCSLAELETREDIDTVRELNHLRESLSAAESKDRELSSRVEQILADESLSDKCQT